MSWSARAFAGAAGVAAIVAAAPPGREPEVEAAIAAEAGPLPVTVVPGGATRAESVAAALAQVRTELVAVHDAARPLVTPTLIEALLARLAADPGAAGAIAAAPVTDTIKRASGDPPVITHTEDRTELWAAQTPQVFRAEGLRDAHAAAADPAAATDDAMLVEAVGGRVLIEPAGPRNLKVTTPTDLRLAELLLAS